jgi:hypothetical protein
MFAIVDMEQVGCPLMLLEDIDEAESIAQDLRVHHGRRITVRRYPSSEPLDRPEVTAEMFKAS